MVEVGSGRGFMVIFSFYALRDELLIKIKVFLDFELTQKS